ncbi:hypothetical protein OG394_26675 [Kribbella sp. NBC_01245]|uniref:hypothetical protein n=1 Tax=Kribbella sp. NBC_01245 TaxID=2903578 RepID=UPI002E2BE35F|nr:hypothetical protein [Kribbella sp. NBC_01245]
MRRSLTALLAALGMVLVPGSAWAADDPPVPQWPAIEQPSGNTSANDPDIQTWPVVDPPASGSTASDPQQPTWPAPENR